MSSKRPFSAFQESNGSPKPSEPSEPSDPSKPSPPKRLRPEPTLWEQITALPLATTHSLIYYACGQNPDIAATVQTSYNDLLAARASQPPVDFSDYSRECWHALNTTYAGYSGSKQYDAVSDIQEVLSNTREAILAHAGPDTRWETRRNALEVLRKISKSVMLCGEEVVRHELMKDGVELGEFAGAMVELARGMTEEEREGYKREGLYAKLVGLQMDCDWEVEMGGLRKLYEIFDGEADEEDEDQDGSGAQELDDDEDGDEEEEKVVEGSATKSLELDTLPAPDILPARSRVFSVHDLL